ncbi:hypothetical protein GGI42DRAFT_38017 [Trichoderma sp. SZMC 28013]
MGEASRMQTQQRTGCGPWSKACSLPNHQGTSTSHIKHPSTCTCTRTRTQALSSFISVFVLVHTRACSRPDRKFGVHGPQGETPSRPQPEGEQDENPEDGHLIGSLLFCWALRALTLACLAMVRAH